MCLLNVEVHTVFGCHHAIVCFDLIAELIMEQKQRDTVYGYIRTNYDGQNSQRHHSNYIQILSHCLDSVY